MKIECTLSSGSLADAAKQLRKYADSLQSKSERLVKDLGEAGVDYANMYLEHDDTGETRSSIQFEQKVNTGVISVGGAAVWIEFGTGVIRNSGSKHPMADELGMSDWGTYGDGNGANEHGWWYPAEGGHKHTFGIRMNPFMYLASQDMRRELLDMAKEAFKND